MSTGDDNAEFCIANIGPRERQKRKRFGVVLLSASALGMLTLVGLDVHRAWRLLMFLPFAAGAAGYFQAVEHT